MLKTTIDDALVFQDVYVTGELSNLVFNKSGHVYFSLKDETSTIGCMMWKTHTEKLRQLHPTDGMKVNVVGKIDYYVPYGKISLVVHDVQIEGIGELQIIYEQRKNQLESQGWFDRSLKKPLPLYPQNIGVVTADTGAVIHDLITTITRRWPLTNIFLFPAKVQGEGASIDIGAKIIQANNFVTNLDVLIVGRGGGSYEDLWAFNEMPTLKAIRNSHIPIISAVGHQPDVTLSDYVADKRAPTPTAAGELATPNIEEIKQTLIYQLTTLKKAIRQVYQEEVHTLTINTQQIVNEIKNFTLHNQTLIAKNLSLMKLIATKLIQTQQVRIIHNENNLMELIKQKDQTLTTKIATSHQFLTMIIKNLTLKWENKLNHDQETLTLLNPTRPLHQGYALIKRNNQILSANQVINNGEELQIMRWFDEITTVVKETKKRGEEDE
ncbi:Exodeoxyribonuclease 7 large subunit [Mesoplasma sp. JKS002658]|nr:Exodeoxyribonuclease 7 large subunit [Mesoplasma sp. JKS002664]MCL8211840.1 Exodeoxyribonuclease 7 large subunit [Mesoplasma sp. JKS002662]MCL8214055.1 Exodeoxyribonuclease 7 large subunit [Mesoplasma sp. JKS002658]MCL8214517.1 Exodeoxyribonuclease 7 large subunit [Mesoplasma sp. JKS002663]MCL8215374.1 Exodeoxyribonuclease 7 large subunit [Mesoplasma sp. JKS002659]